ncbi:MAG: retropepsin-like domain-containing protein [Paramuribaculum sp.]|nr:retropepsin-like domain-containing protein [Paramuribaculum sp.]
MKKIIFSFLLLFSFISKAQSIDEQIASAMNSGDWIALDSVYNEAPKDSIWDFLEVYSRCLIGNRLNRPEVSIPAFAELLQTHSEELDLGNLFSCSLMYAIDLSKVGKNKEAAELLASILDATKQYLDSANIAVIQNQKDLYSALSNYEPYTLSFKGEKTSIPFSIINSENNKGSRLKLDKCSINGIEADITFDTGAALNVISQEMADKLQLIPLDASVIVGGINDVDGRYVLAKEIKFGNLTVMDVPFVILPLETGNEEADKFLNQYGIIIGTPFMLQIKDFTLDFINNEITIPTIAPERTNQKPNMFFGDGMTFSAKGKVLNEPMIMHIDTGNADYADLGSQFYVNNKEFVETHGKLESVGRAGAGGVHKSEVYLVSDIPIELGGNTVVPAEILVAIEDLSDISALRFDCNIGLKTLMMYGKVRFNLVDFVLSTQPR